MLRVVVAGLAAVPSGWFAAVLVDRIPDARPLWRPRPGVPWPGEPHARDATVVLLTTALFVAGALRIEDLAVLLPVLALFVVLVALSAIDVATLRLPDRLVLPSLVASAVVLPLASVVEGELRPLLYAAIGAAFYFVFLFVAFLVYPRGMGFGDVKLSLLMGLYLGWLASDWLGAVALVLYAMLAGFLLGTVAGIAVLIARGRSSEYPFGPFLAAGAVLVILFSEELLAR